MSDHDEDDDELDWDEWMKLTDAQAEAIVQREMDALCRWLDSLTPAQWYRHQRGRALRSLREARAFLARPMPNGYARFECVDVLQRERIARNRRRLLKLRVFRATGVWPGEG